MRNARIKKRVTILVGVCVVLLVGALIANHYLDKSYLVEIKYKEVMKKIDNKEDFVLLLSQTTCSHCRDYKPKLRKVAREYKLTIYYLETNLLSEEESKEIKKNFNFSDTPTTVFVNEGVEKTAASRIVGDVGKAKIISKLKSNGFID